jgi:hypothetical protein
MESEETFHDFCGLERASRAEFNKQHNDRPITNMIMIMNDDSCDRDLMMKCLWAQVAIRYE